MIARLLRTALVLGVLPLALAACGDDDSDPMGPAAGSASVRVAHLSPDAGLVDVRVDGSVVLSAVPYRAVSEYLDLEAGTHQVQVTPHGASTPAVIDATLTLADGTSYTVVARGLLATSGVTATVLEDDRTTVGSDAKVRFVHGSPDAPPVDVTLTDGTVLFGAIAFGEASTIQAVGAGSYDLQVRGAGSSTVVVSFGDVPLSGGTNYTVFAVGQLSDGSLDAIVAVDAPGPGSTVVDLTPATAEVRVGHLSPDAPNVDVWVDGAVVPALVDVPFGAVSAYLTLGAVTHDVKVYVTGTSTAPVIDTPLTLLPGASYTVAATGLVGAGDLSPIVLEDDRTPAAAGNAHVRFVHTSPDAPAVNVQVAGGGPTLFSSTVFREAEAYQTVSASTYDLEVRLASNGALALSVPAVTLASGTNTTIFAIGLAGDASLSALPVVDAP